MAAYIERGDVRFIYQHRIVRGAQSLLAAEAVECAGEQGKFWAYHSALYANQGRFARASLKGYATSLGLNQAAFATCLDTGRYRSKVQEQDKEAAARGIDSTPSFLIGNQLVKGLPPVSELMKFIDSQLQQP